MTRTDLLDGEGENRAIRTFLLLYGGGNGAVSIAEMRGHMNHSGWEGCWPAWVDQPGGVSTLTKSGAQLWIRHLISLEPIQSAAPMSRVDLDAQRALSVVADLMRDWKAGAKTSDETVEALFLNFSSTPAIAALASQALAVQPLATVETLQSQAVKMGYPECMFEFNASQAPAVQQEPVAGVVSRIGDQLRVGWLRPESVEVGSLLYTSPSPQGDAEDALTQAARDVLAERRRQIEIEGFKPDADDEYDAGISAMGRAASCYAIPPSLHRADGAPPSLWPWAKEWWKPTTYRRNLIKAAALILAEIERIDRSANDASRKPT